MYLQQPTITAGVEEVLDITRTYNSRSQRVGLFGTGWSPLTMIVKTYDSTLLNYIAGCRAVESAARGRRRVRADTSDFAVR